MATIKDYTDISQSKTLSKILPLKSANMSYMSYDNHITLCPYNGMINDGFYEDEVIPCWSLAALLSVLPKIGSEEPIIQKLYYANNPTERYICQYGFTNITGEYDNPVDACVAMIENLHKLKIL